jgi:hypothetical protein
VDLQVPRGPPNSAAGARPEQARPQSGGTGPMPRAGVSVLGAGKTDPTPGGGGRVGIPARWRSPMSPGGTPHGIRPGRCALSCYPTPFLRFGHRWQATARLGWPASDARLRGRGPWGARCPRPWLRAAPPGPSRCCSANDVLIPAAFHAAANLPMPDLGGRTFTKGIRVTLASTPAC